MMLGITVLAAAAAVSVRRRGCVDRAVFAGMLLLLSAAVLSTVPQPVLTVGGVALPTSILLEACGVAVSAYLLCAVCGYRTALGVLLAAYIVAVPIDALLYFGSLDRSYLLVSAVYNAVVVVPALFVVLATARREVLSISV